MTYRNPNRQPMKVNVNHPSFISFLETISNNILSAIKIEEYFNLTAAKKLTVSFTVLNLLKNSAKVKANLSDTELKSFISVLCKKNEEAEKKLNKVLTKTAFIVRKEDHLVGFEEYIKEVSKRLGLNYQPYQG